MFKNAVSKENDESRQIPTHIAIVMDGNGRWAKKRMLMRSAGHRAGAQALRKLAIEANKIGLKYLTVYALSTENWGRPTEEIQDLMNLLRNYIQEYINDSKKNNMRLSVIGERTRLDKDLQDKINNLEEITKNKTGLHIVIALNYGGRDDITRAVKKIFKEMQKNAESPDYITEEVISKHLDTADIPDPDLIIRTSGEQRISNFLVWQMAYSEMYFSEKFWPDFTIDDLNDAISKYQQRDRRFGKV